MNTGARRLPSRQLIELLCKALVDEELREKFFAQPDALALEFCLSPAESEAIRMLDRRKFEQAAVRLR